uniref:LDLR chaperone MESD n=1 Tax=Strigamia maritima TaxID=126957 RepID=T1J0Q2_STRMM
MTLRSCVILTWLFLNLLFNVVHTKKKDEKDKPAWAKKDIRDYNDADVERLFDQWEEDEDPLEPDELPEHLRPSPKLDFSKANPADPESLLKLSKKGKTLMVFVTVSGGSPDPIELEDITKLWQTSLMNNHIQFTIDEKRAIFMFRDGSQAWEAKNFLVEQDRCEEVTIENKSFPGKRSNNKKSEL